MTAQPSTQEHEYAGDPKHCHACALRAFVNAELRTRAAEQQIAELRSQLQAVSYVNHDQGDALSKLTQQIAELARERDEQRNWVNRITDNTAAREAMRVKLSVAEERLALLEAREGELRTLVEEWRHDADMAEKHLAFNLAHNNTEDDAHIHAIRVRADELAALLTPKETR